MRFNNKIVEAIAINEIRGTFQTRLNIGWSRRCPHILIKCTRLSRKEERKRDSVDFTHCVCVRPTLLQFLAPRSSFPSLSLPRRRVIAHPRAIASLLPCRIGERIPRLWSVPPPGIYISTVGCRTLATFSLSRENVSFRYLRRDNRRH